MEQQREVDGGSMETIVEQSLGDIEGGYTSALILQAIENELVFANTGERQLKAILERLLHVVGVERGERTYILHVLMSESQDVGVSTHHHRKMAEEPADESQ